jgi:hypothetical protein
MHDNPKELTRVGLGEYLLAVYTQHREHHEKGFDAMVDLFASDPFYRGHLIAKRYKELNNK